MIVGLLFLGSASFMILGVTRFFWDTLSAVLQPGSGWTPWSIIRLSVVVALVSALVVAARVYRKG